MSVQFHFTAASAARDDAARGALPRGRDWLRPVLGRAAQMIELWNFNRRVARSRRMLESLPENIRHDIGWPAVEDRLPGADHGHRRVK